MLIQGLFQKISENPALSDLVYLAGLQEHFQKNLTVLPSEGITDVQAEALIKALKGEIENDRSALDAWITRYFADGSKARLLHGKEKSLAELIRSVSINSLITSDIRYL